MTALLAPGTAPTEAAGDVDVHRLLDQAEFALRSHSAALESVLLGVLDRGLHTGIATLGVGLRRDGLPRLDANPDYVVDFTANDLAFMLAHEAWHLLLNHVRDTSTNLDRAAELACEVVVNHLAMRSLDRTDLPRRLSDGTTSGIDPRAVHADYVAAVVAPLGYDDFVANDEVCVEELRRMYDAEPDAAAGLAPCEAGDAPDPEQAGPLVERALDLAMDRALDGDETLKQQLLGLGAVFPTSPALARLGLGRLRGEASRTGSTRLWQAHLARVVGTALEPGVEVAYCRKTGWWDATVLASAGIDVPASFAMPLLPVATDIAVRRVSIYLDTSGSVESELIDVVSTMIGEIPSAQVRWSTFDHEVHPFEPGEDLLGGGGTSFAVIAEHVDGLDEQTDAVLVLTDGYGPEIDPPDRDRWIWLITPEGDLWPADRGMTCIAVDPSKDHA